MTDEEVAGPLVMPRLVVAAPASGAGKTTVATGLMAALTARGLRVSPHKVGPDYIDPSYHTLATGRPGRNLDAVLCGASRIGPLFAHGARGCDLAVIEGVMGLFDGVARPAATEEADHASTAHVARLLDAPVVLVVDARGAGRSVAALVHGFRSFDPRLRLAGVVLNRVGSDRHTRLLTGALDDLGVPVLGALPRDDGVHTPSRHLGLVPAAERADAATVAVRRLGELVAARCDLDVLVRLARTAPPLRVARWRPDPGPDPVSVSAGVIGSADTDTMRGPRPVRVAVAGGPAFTFGYAEHAELLAAAGAEVITVDPLRDETLPAGTDALVVGGGFPEEHAARLTENVRLRGEVAAFAGRGGPVVAECAGLLYLSRRLDGRPMCGVLDVEAAMGPRLTLGYRNAVAACDSPVAAAGTVVRAHEFHRTALVSRPRTVSVSAGRNTPADTDTATAGTGTAGTAHGAAAWWLDGAAEGFVQGRVYASYLHLHWAGTPWLPARLVAAARTARTAGRTP